MHPNHNAKAPNHRISVHQQLQITPNLILSFKHLPTFLHCENQLSQETKKRHEG